MEEKTDPSNFKAFRLDAKHTFGEAGEEEGPHKSNFQNGDILQQRRW